MACPISTRPARSPPIEWSEALAPELAESAAAIRELLELVRLLDERGVLRFSSDLLREEDRVVAVLTDRLSAGDVRRAIRNLEVLVKTFRDLDPGTLGALARGMPAALSEAHRAERDRPMGIFEIVSTLRDPEVNRGVRMVLGFLRGIGRDAPPPA